MGSVQSAIKCPSCGYSECWNDFYYKTGENYIMCGRCGYYEGYTAKTNIAKGKKKVKNAEKLVKEGKLKLAIEVLEISFIGTKYDSNKKPIKYTEKDLNDKERLEHIRNKIKRIKECKYKYYFKMNREGKIEYTHKILKNGVETKYKIKGAVATCCGGTTKKELPKFRKWVNDNKKSIEKVSANYLEGSKWITEDILTGKKIGFKR